MSPFSRFGVGVLLFKEGCLRNWVRWEVGKKLLVILILSHFFLYDCKMIVVRVKINALFGCERNTCRQNSVDYLLKVDCLLFLPYPYFKIIKKYAEVELIDIRKP